MSTYTFRAKCLLLVIKMCQKSGTSIITRNGYLALEYSQAQFNLSLLAHHRYDLIYTSNSVAPTRFTHMNLRWISSEVEWSLPILQEIMPMNKGLKKKKIVSNFCWLNPWTAMKECKSQAHTLKTLLLLPLSCDFENGPKQSKLEWACKFKGRLSPCTIRRISLKEHPQKCKHRDSAQSWHAANRSPKYRVHDLVHPLHVRASFENGIRTCCGNLSLWPLMLLTLKVGQGNQHGQVWKWKLREIITLQSWKHLS